ncbi:MAG: Mur ligase family protein, partial [Patescibacteria group bacterium]
DKKYIFSAQGAKDSLIINWDQEVLRMLEGEVRSGITKFSVLGNPGDNSVYLEDGSLFWNNGIDKKKIIDVKEIKLRGKHNVGNILAAIGATLAVGVKIPDIKKAVSNFSGIPHRLEWVREFQGVNYFNDTAATTPESASGGIESFDEPVILIAGGSDKNLDFSILAEVISRKPQKTILLRGEASDKILEELKKIGREKISGLNYLLASSMEEAVSMAKSLAKSGDVILLSPGAASFGMFKNEFDRGDKFKEAVNGLK